MASLINKKQLELARKYARMAGAGGVYKGPLFSQVLPFEKAWGSFQPLVQEEASSVIDPFVQRELARKSRDYMYGLAGGAGRFGKAWGGLGELGAESEQSRRAQLLDWINQRRSGFEELFYNPAESAFTRAIEFGQAPKAPKIPTWKQLQKSYNTMYEPKESPSVTQQARVPTGEYYYTQPVM